MNIFLVRHGQSQWQVDPSSGLDAALTPCGHDQSSALAERLGAMRGQVAGVFVSPLQRARETAGYVTGALALPALVLEGLAEAPFRVADHLPRFEAPFGSPRPYEPSPRYLAFKEQATETLRKLVVAARGGTVVAVTHGGLIKTLLRVVVGTDALCFNVGNASLSAIEWREGRWHMNLLNSEEHLMPSLRTA